MRACLFNKRSFESEDDSTASPPAVLYKHDAIRRQRQRCSCPNPPSRACSRSLLLPSRVVALSPPAANKWVPHARRPPSQPKPQFRNLATAELFSSLSLVLQRRIEPSFCPCSVRDRPGVVDAAGAAVGGESRLKKKYVPMYRYTSHEE